jgi:hypothetical protein
MIYDNGHCSEGPGRFLFLLVNILNVNKKLFTPVLFTRRGFAGMNDGHCR